MHVTEQRTLPAPKTVPRHRYRDRHVDADHTHLDAAGEFAGDVTVAGVARRAVAELMGVDQIDRLGKILDAHARQHRSEDFFLVDLHLGGDMVEHRATQPEAPGAIGTGLRAIKAAAVDQQLGTFSDALLDVAGDALVRRLRDDRAHFGGQVHALEDLQRARALQQFRHDLVGHVADKHRHRDRHAALAGRTEGRADQRVDHLVDVGIGHHHHVVLRPAQRLDALAMASPGLVDVVGDRRRADEAHGLDFRVVEQRIHGFLVALHHIEHAVWQPGFLEQLGDQQRR
ncbi:hypothetical protein D9M71_514030 [compost metagenome]